MKAKGFVIKNSDKMWSASMQTLDRKPVIQSFLQPSMKSAIRAVNKMAKVLGWELEESFEKIG